MGDNGDLKTERTPSNPPNPSNDGQKDFKVAEIWIRNGSIMLDASPEFWADKLRAIGVFEYCKDIVRNFNQPKKEIIKPSGFMNFARNFKRKK